jgi:hypothetical protein
MTGRRASLHHPINQIPHCVMIQGRFQPSTFLRLNLLNYLYVFIFILPSPFCKLGFFTRFLTNLMFCWPCIVIYPYNKNQQDALLLSIYFNNQHVHVSSRLTAYHQEVILCIYSNWYMWCVYVDWLLAGSCRIVHPVASYWKVIYEISFVDKIWYSGCSSSEENALSTNFCRNSFYHIGDQTCGLGDLLCRQKKLSPSTIVSNVLMLCQISKEV